MRAEYETKTAKLDSDFGQKMAARYVLVSRGRVDK
jgi:hypothetical protein